MTSQTVAFGGIPREQRAQLDGWQVLHCALLAEMTPVLDAVAGVLIDHGFPAKNVFGVRLALEEAVCNAIKHGHRHDPTKVVEIRYWIRPDHAIIDVEDQGPGFDPSRVPDARAPENLERPGGRGLLLIHHYTAWVRHNREGNCITFCVCPSAQGAEASVGA